VPGGDRVYVTTRDASGAYTSWLVNADGSAPRKLKLPEGRALFGQPLSPDGTRVLMTCPKGVVPCVVPLDGSEPVPVPGAKAEWMATGWDANGRLYFRDRPKRFPETLWRLDPASGRAHAIAPLAPRDLAGAQSIAGVVVSSRGDAWVYNVLRRLSDLHVVTGVR
jgi:hypothetical protein